MKKRVLITVRTYPTPAKKGVEVSCTAGITDDGEWIRLYPIPYRLMDPDKRFGKYQWIELEATKASDPRPESFTPNIDSIQIARRLTSTQKWHDRKDVVFPLRGHCLCCIEQTRRDHGAPTLGIFRPRVIKRLLMEQDDPQWSPQQLANLRQYPLFAATPSRLLEKIPYKFRYEFQCDHEECVGHSISCTDWEMCQAYRSWKREYRSGWEAKFREKFEHDMIHKNDTHFYVGTLHGHPATWIIVGLFYPRRDETSDRQLRASTRKLRTDPDIAPTLTASGQGPVVAIIDENEQE
jgi:hypothetical protein